MDTEQAIKRWNQYAERYTANYNEYGDTHREVLLNPTIFSLLEEVDGKHLLDAGCGEGYLSRLLVKKGAIVTAVDFSQKMLDIAMERTPQQLPVQFFYGNCENLAFLADNQFDRIVSNMVLQDLEDYRATIREMYRLLKPNSTFVFSILHPCFVTPNSGWIRHEQLDQQYWKVQRYFYEGVYQQLTADPPIVLFHRTLTSYVEAITEAGFHLEKIVEPRPSQEMLEKYPQFEEDLHCADFIVFKLKK
ncbi:class I SAM-dependent methyltransferase [Lysinibacillus fusiformis]|uniref:class I SAM-dependent methyltransferase n=1 Tax=Lysinibacillus fusiformis TaxID=28031 RepID=UPI00215A7D30|nr:class I SAM-dependent methyltransferase [Lysinibacillus fusiformis]MCR8851790.1 class I SAM-dependent methyltransferase [Lysinibacillus fusiformis]WKT78303.1 class I SAM-dependent methyltransferase [Lysinibacillus fusiformis]